LHPDQDLDPVLVEGARLTPPRRHGDCTCVFCGLYRSHHYVWRASLTSALVPVAFWFALVAGADTGGQRQDGYIVGALLLIVTAVAVLALASWQKPLHRMLHLLHPRSRVWPPP
jgi:hypothetical protein